MAETQKEIIMRTLKVTAEEADEILACDKAIDRGERTYFDFDKDKEKEIIKEARKGLGHKKPTVYNFDTTNRKRKENPTKAGIIQYLYECLTDYENVAITNKERQIIFSANDNDYELTLVQKRKKKE